MMRAERLLKRGKKYDVIEVPEPVGVLVQKTDSTSGNVVKGAGFAVFKDAACTQRVLTDGDSGTEIRYFIMTKIWMVLLPKSLPNSRM